MNNLQILYEDNHLLVVIKPINILSQSDYTKDLDMLTILKKYLKEKYQKPGNVYLGLVHRLDRPTGGIMVFARTSKAASRLSKQIKDGYFKKTYLAVVHGKTNKKDTLKNYLLKEKDKSIITTKEKGKYAELDYELLEYNETYDLSLLKIINGLSRTLNIANQMLPLYKQIKPLINNSNKIFNSLRNINHPINNNNKEIKEIKAISSSSPTFFQ